MSSITLRAAVETEREALEALQWRASLANPNDREALLAHPDAIDLPLRQILAGQVFVAEQDGCILGFATILPSSDGEQDLDALFVEPASWKRGIGRLLVDHVSNVAADAGANALHVVGNPHAEGFYKSCRFETIGVEQTRFGVGLLMRKRLT